MSLRTDIIEIVYQGRCIDELIEMINECKNIKWGDGIIHLLESSHQVFTIASLDEKIKFVDFILSEDLI